LQAIICPWSPTSRSNSNPMLGCNHMPDYSIGVDLGGTNLRAASITVDGAILEQVSVPTNVALGPQVVIGHIADAVNQLRATQGQVPAGIGVGVPGFIDLERGIIRGSANMPGFQDFPVRDELSNRLGVPIVLENDANAAALGEKWMGAGRDVEDLLLLTLGTGVGGGIIYRGAVMHGFLGMAGEVGHVTVVPNGNPCGCGNRGCLEKHASATAVESMANLMGLGEALSAKQVYDLAIQGNRSAEQVFESMGLSLGTAMASFINLFNFPLYLLAGGVVDAWPLFAPAMLAEIERRSFTYRNSRTRVERARLGKDSGLYGAAYLPFLHRAH
jgi:glucokinase